MERKYCKTNVFLKTFLSISTCILDAGPQLTGIPDTEGGGGDTLIFYILTPLVQTLDTDPTPHTLQRD